MVASSFVNRWLGACFLFVLLINDIKAEIRKDDAQLYFAIKTANAFGSTAAIIEDDKPSDDSAFTAVSAVPANTQILSLAADLIINEYVYGIAKDSSNVNTIVLFQINQTEGSLMPSVSTLVTLPLPNTGYMGFIRGLIYIWDSTSSGIVSVNVSNPSGARSFVFGGVNSDPVGLEVFINPDTGFPSAIFGTGTLLDWRPNTGSPSPQTLTVGSQNIMDILYDIKRDWFYVLCTSELVIVDRKQFVGIRARIPLNTSWTSSPFSQLALDLMLSDEDTVVLYASSGTSATNGQVLTIRFPAAVTGILVNPIGLISAPTWAQNRKLTGLVYVPPIIQQPESIDSIGHSVVFDQDYPTFSLLNRRVGNLATNTETTSVVYGDFNGVVPFPEDDWLLDVSITDTSNTYTYSNVLETGVSIEVSLVYSAKDSLLVNISDTAAYPLDPRTVKTTLKIHRFNLGSGGDLFNANNKMPWSVCYTDTEDIGIFDLNNVTSVEVIPNQLLRYIMPRTVFIAEDPRPCVLNIPLVAKIDGVDVFPLNETVLNFTRANGEVRACIYWEFPYFDSDFVYDPDVGVLVSDDGGDGDGGDGDGVDSTTIGIAVGVSVGGACLIVCCVIVIALIVGAVAAARKKELLGGTSSQYDSVQL